MNDRDALTAVSLLPKLFQPVFNFRFFNPVQSEVFHDVFMSDMNMVISAPTGSGKTVLLELCVLRLFLRCITPEGNLHYTPGSLKTIYIAPLKALVQEKQKEWSQRFGQVLGLNCRELTGDADISNAKDLQETDIILTTPEKFDMITRRHRDHGGLSFFGDIALVLIDEVHLLSDPRGAALEAVVSRLKMISRYPEMKSSALSNIRFIAISATIPNIEDIAEWLMVPPEGNKKFCEETRPVKLSTRVLGYAPAKNDFLFERKLQTFLYDILLQHSRKKPALVFCSTRKGAQEAAITLAKTAVTAGLQNPFIKSRDHYERLQLAAHASSDKNMQFCIQNGVAYHNGGLKFMERSLVEELFSKGDLQVLCTTNTLAYGVNLPAHTVVVKSTQYFCKEKGGYSEYDRATILQMCGRAGRPQFDNSGVVIIMTRKETVHLYENLLLGSEPVESELLPCIAEHLIAEIVLMTVSDVSLAIDWLKCSYLYVRIKKNARRYIDQNFKSMELLEGKIKEICLKNVDMLARSGVIETDENGYILKSLEPAKLMTKYYLYFETMKAIIKTPMECPLEEFLHILARSQELSWIKLRRNEKKFLNDINCDSTGRIRFHVYSPNGKSKKRIQTDAEKIFVLINDALSGEPSTLDFTMSQDVNSISSNGARIVRCMSEYFLYEKRFKEAVNTLTLTKCLHQKLWENSRYQLKQLVGVGMVTTKALLEAGISTFDMLSQADPRRLEFLTGRKYPFGDHLKGSLDALPPKMDVKFSQQHQTDQIIRCALTLTRVTESRTTNKRHFSNLVVGNQGENKILFHERIRLDLFSSPYTINIQEAVSHNKPTEIIAALIFEEFVGIDVVEKLEIGSKNDSTASEVRENFTQRMTRSKKLVLNQAQPTVGKTTPKAKNYEVRIEFPKELISEEDAPSQKAAADHMTGETTYFDDGPFSAPSFSLMSSDQDEGQEKADDWNRKSVTLSNVFEHIRKKSKTLPSFACFQAPSASTSPLSPSAATLQEEAGDTFSIHEKLGGSSGRSERASPQNREDACIDPPPLLYEDSNSSRDLVRKALFKAEPYEKALKSPLSPFQTSRNTKASHNEAETDGVLKMYREGNMKASKNEAETNGVLKMYRTGAEKEGGPSPSFMGCMSIFSFL